MDKPTYWGIDGDIIVYRVGFASDKNEDSLEGTLKGVKNALQDIINACGEKSTIYLTGKGNFRFDLDANYKGNRGDAGKPRFYQEIRDYMVDELGAVMVEGQEADDALAIGAVQHGHGIATLDKDLDGCPGWHFNWVKDNIYYVSEVEADRFFYTQMLTGDATDNIPGLFKMVGKKAMPKIKAPLQEMTTPAEMYDHVYTVYCDGYEEAGMCLDEMHEVVDAWLLRIGRLLWMRRKVNQMWEVPRG
jgi:hypothetical protein